MTKRQLENALGSLTLLALLRIGVDQSDAELRALASPEPRWRIRSEQLQALDVIVPLRSDHRFELLPCAICRLAGLSRAPSRRPDHGAQMRFQIGHLETKSQWMIYIQA